MHGSCKEYSPDIHAQGDCLNCGRTWEEHKKDTPEKDNIRLLTTTGKPTHEMCEDLQKKITDVIYSYDGEMTLAAAVGVLEIVKSDLIEDHRT